MPAADRAQVSPEWLERLRAAPQSDPWTQGFNVVERSSGASIGSCGFKGPPDTNSTAEIAYYIDPKFRHQGFATEAAQALVGFAHTHNVRLVRAHTLADNAASIGVLIKCGFRLIGEVVDPEDGPVMRWESANPLA